MNRLRIPVHLRWGDMDAFNHVNNATMLTLLEEARIRAFWAPQDGEDAPPTAVVDASIASGTLMLIARQEIEYLAPVPYRRSPLDIQMWFSRIGGSSLDIFFEVRDDPSDGPEPTEYARALCTVVKVDADSGRPLRLSAGERAAWEPYVGEPLAFHHRR